MPEDQPILTDAPLNPAELLNSFQSALPPSCGAVVMFQGTMRSQNPQSNKPHVLSLTLEPYREMCALQMNLIRRRALSKFNLLNARIAHRYGTILPKDVIVVALAAAPHRHNAFLGAQFLMDHLKTDAPFWKRETTNNNSHWVNQNPDDLRAKQSWNKPPK